MVNQSASAQCFGPNLDLLFDSLTAHTHVLVAVSGGSDSVALLYLLHDWAKECDVLKLSVATIDHKLRISSADEATQVGEIAKKLGLPHIIEKWAGDKPVSAVSQKAREARYALLAKIANDVGATAIALGHNLDDQRETIMMRAQRVKFSDFDNASDENTNLGLAGIHSYVSYCGPPDFKSVALVRPVLSVTRAKLRLFLKSIGENWIDDPSNEDDHYERVRLRKQLVAHPAKYPTAYRVEKFCSEVAEIREELARNCTQFMGEHVTWQQSSGPGSGCISGVIEIDRSAFLSSDKYIMRYLLRALIGIAGGQNFLISPDKAMELVKDSQEGTLKQQSIGSTIIALKKNSIRIWREYRNLRAIKVTKTGPRVISWDGRIVYRFSDDYLDRGFELKSLGEMGVTCIETDLQRKLEAKPRQALFTQPAIYKDDKLLFAPMLNWCSPDFKAPECEYWTPALEQFQPDCDFGPVDMVSQLRYRPAN